MNQSQLRPPQRVFQGLVGFMVAPAILCATCYLHMGILQRLYFSSFARVEVLPSLEGRISHKIVAHDRTLYCAPGAGGDTPAIDGMTDLADLHPAQFPMTTVAYKGWLERFIYHGKIAPFLKRPVLMGLAVSLVLFMAAWKLDRARHLKFRSTPRHIRGSQLLTRAEFRRKVRGEGSGWLVQQFRPGTVRPAGIGWRTEDFTEED